MKIRSVIRCNWNIFYYMVIFLFISLSCTKERSYDHYRISDDFRKWVDFKDGSYWVYINENSGLIDSCYIIYKGAFTQTEYQDVGYVYDVIDIILSRSTFFHEIYIQAEANFNWAAIGLTKGVGDYGLRNDIKKGQRIVIGKGTYEVVDVLDSMQINNYYFRNVIHTRSANPWKIDSIIHEYFFSKGIGLIRLHQTLLHTDSTWNLLRWKTIQ